MKYVSITGKDHFEEHPIDNDVIEYAAKITAESHNMGHPDDIWVVSVREDVPDEELKIAEMPTCPPPPPPPPVTSNDPILGEWQACLCLDSGEIIDGKIYTAEFDFNWVSFKTTLPLQCESYNLAHPDNKAHVVWGTDKII